jgi:hypothetical protein
MTALAWRGVAWRRPSSQKARKISKKSGKSKKKFKKHQKSQKNLEKSRKNLKFVIGLGLRPRPKTRMGQNHQKSRKI